MRLAIVGIGRWGKNLLQEFSRIASVTVAYNKKSTANRAWLKQNYPHIRVASSYAGILRDRSIDAVVIATPIATHHTLAKKALQANKHVFLEKPSTMRTTETKKLFALAKKKKRRLFLGYTFLYHPVFQRIKKLRPKYAVFDWSKTGTFDEPLVWNLLSHDVAMLLQLFGRPVRVQVLEKKGVQTECDVLTLQFTFPQGRQAMVHINRASPEKRKTVLLKTAKGLLLWNGDTLYTWEAKKWKRIYRSTLSSLRAECRAFLRETKPFNDMEVIRVLSKIAGNTK